MMMAHLTTILYLTKNHTRDLRFSWRQGQILHAVGGTYFNSIDEVHPLRKADESLGSSREHAPWALLDFEIRAIFAPRYADIFFNNTFKNGIANCNT